MYCEFCGSRIADDSLFCESCGRPVDILPDRVQKAQTQGNTRYRKKEKTAGLKIGKLLVAIALIAVTIFACSFLFSEKTDLEENDISLVQNGYLGEYTDITVKEILDSYYGMLYEKEEWDSGETDSGTKIVQAKYYDEGMEEDATTIQLTMLNEECFKITAFVDPLNPVEKTTDLLAAMNYNYLLAYMAENRSVAGDILAEKDFIARLGQISGSAVQYGASAEYSGNRAAICEIDGSAPLDVSVAMLLDNYGLLDMSYYSTDIDFPAIESTEDNASTSNEASIVASGFEGIDEKNVIISDNFWNNHSACSDPMAGEFFNYEHDMMFWVYAGETPNGDISYLLEYTLGGETVEADGEVWESIITAIIPSSEVIIANKSSSIIFDIGAYHPQYSGTFIFDMYYTGDGTEYTVCADIPGIIDTNGNSVSIEVISLFDWY